MLGQALFKKKRPKIPMDFENKDALFIGLCTGVFGHFFLTVGLFGAFSYTVGVFGAFFLKRPKIDKRAHHGER
jgi:hypothetical protein